MTRIAVIGGGKIGGTLGDKWAAAGHEVRFGLRDPSRRPGAVSAGSALEGAEVVLLAVPGGAVTELAREHAAGLDGRLVIDASNAFGNPGRFHVWPELQPLLPNARLYRAFNTLGWEVFADPVIDGVQADLFFAGADGPDRETVARLIADIGLRAVWLGGPEVADEVDGAVALYFRLSRRLGRRIALKLLSEGGGH